MVILSFAARFIKLKPFAAFHRNRHVTHNRPRKPRSVPVKVEGCVSRIIWRNCDAQRVNEPPSIQSRAEQCEQIPLYNFPSVSLFVHSLRAGFFFGPLCSVFFFSSTASTSPRVALFQDNIWREDEESEVVQCHFACCLVVSTIAEKEKRLIDERTKLKLPKKAADNRLPWSAGY